MPTGRSSRSDRLDRARAERALAFMGRLPQVKGRWAGRPLELAPWQREIVTELFGRVGSDGRRRYQFAYISVPRKCGKTTLATAIALYLLFADGEHGAEVYSAATSADQASLVYQLAAAMVRRSPPLRRRARVIDSLRRIVVPATDSLYRALPADEATAWGLNPSGVIVDELHAWRRRELWEALTTGSRAREQPLVVIITTAGWDRQSIWREVYEHACRVRDGLTDDPRWFTWIREPPPGSDWRSRRVWRYCNPALGSILSMEEIEEAYRRAEGNPVAEAAFRRLYLNDATTEQEQPAIPLAIWDKGSVSVPLEELEGAECVGGIDLGQVSDLSAFVLLFPRPGGAVYALVRAWTPQDRLADTANPDRQLYRTLVTRGWLRVAPGPTVTASLVRDQVLEDARRYRIRSVAADPWHAPDLIRDLNEAGIETVSLSQTMANLAAPSAELERLVLEGRLWHGGNPLLRWQVANLIWRTDISGNRRPDKRSSRGKIDAITALINALERLIRIRGERAPVWEREGLRWL